MTQRFPEIALLAATIPAFPLNALMSLAAGKTANSTFVAVKLSLTFSILRYAYLYQTSLDIYLGTRSISIGDFTKLIEDFTKLIDGCDHSNPKLKCMVCFEDFWLDEGLACDPSKTGTEFHFTCKDCFNGYLQSSATYPISYWKERNYELTCMKPFSIKALAISSFVNIFSPESFDAYQSILLKISESRVTQELGQIFEQQIEQATKESTIRGHVQRIQEEILNLKCPSCKVIFIDFDGCFALKCNNCGCGFCAWCLQNCGTDAHPHVRKCANSWTDGNLYGIMEQFQQCHEIRKADLVKQYYEQIITDHPTIDKVKQSLSLLSIETLTETLSLPISPHEV